MKSWKTTWHRAVFFTLFCVAFSCTLKAQVMPPEVTLALQGYSKIDPLTLQLKGTRKKGGKSTELNSSYHRQGDSFSWVQTFHSDGVSPKVITHKFDGDVFSAAHGNQDASWYKAENLVRTQPKTIRFRVAYLEAAGIFCPNRAQDWAGLGLESSILHLLKADGQLVSCEQTQLDNEDVVRIEVVADNPAWHDFAASQSEIMKHEENRLKSKQISVEEHEEIEADMNHKAQNMPQQLRWIYYLSPENGYAVLKHERLTVDGEIVESYHNSSFAQIPGADLMFPKRVMYESFEENGMRHYKLRGKPRVSIDWMVTSFSCAEVPPKNQFVLDRRLTPAGAKIIDAVTPDLQRSDGTAIVFDMPAKPENLDSAIANAQGKFVPYNNAPRWSLTFLFLNVVFIGLILWRQFSSREKRTDT